MVASVKVKGMDRTLAGLNREEGRVKNKAQGGMLAGALVFLGDAQRRVPVEYGKVRASGFVARGVKPLSVLIGFSAAYALYVHENLQQKLKGQPRKSGLGKYWGPQGEPQFLLKALRAKRGEALKAIAKHAKVKE